MANSPLKDFASSILFGTTPGVTRPTVKAPNPFDNDDRMDISDRFRSTQDYSSSSSSSASQQSYSYGSTEGTDPYGGPLDVSAMAQSVADQFVGMDKRLGAALSPLGFNPFIAAGAGLSKKNLENIESKIAEGASGYSLGMLDGRIIGVSPNAFGGYSLSGVLPQGITDVQRRQLINNLLDLNPITELVGGKFNPDDLYSGYTKGTATDDMINIIKSGVPPEAAAYDYSEFFDNSGNVISDYYGDPGDDSDPPPGNQYTVPSSPAPDYTPPPSNDYYGDPGDSSANAGTPVQQEDDFNPSDPGGGGSSDSGGDYGTPDFDIGDYMRQGGRVGMQTGGTASKDPVQSTGFVDGPPQNYAKGTTVADTENHRVRVGSFVLNAPTTERLQKEGKLPKGPQKRKAAKGGKMMEVALSKGEYVIDVDDIGKFGGYNALNKENNKGKPEVERRQAAAQGGFLGGYSNGGNMTLPTPSPVRQRTAQKEEDIPLPNVPDSFRKKLIQFMKPIVDADKKPNRTQINNFIKNLDPKEQLAFLFLTETVSNSAPMVEMENLGEVVFNRVDSDYRDFSKLTNQEQVLLQHVDNNPKKSKQFTGLEPSTVFARAKDVVGGLAEPGLRKAYAASENVHSDDPDRASLRRLPYATVFYTKKDAPNQWMRESKDLEYAGEKGGHEYYRPISISVKGAQEAAQKYRYTNINPEFP